MSEGPARRQALTAIAGRDKTEASEPDIAQISPICDNVAMAKSADNALMLEILKDLRKEVRDVRTLVLQLADRTRRLEQYQETQFVAVNQRLNGLKDDLELMIKSELMGRLGNFEIRMMNLIEERLAEKAD